MEYYTRSDIKKEIKNEITTIMNLALKSDTKNLFDLVLSTN